MAKRYNFRKKQRLERSFFKGTNKPKRRNKSQKGIDFFFLNLEQKLNTKKRIRKKYRAKVSR